MTFLKIIYPRHMVCFRYIIVNTLHKGDNKDNNNSYNNNNNNVCIIMYLIIYEFLKIKEYH